MITRIAREPTVLLSTVSSDSHTWNLVYLELLLEENGYRVSCLGACVPDELLLETALRERPDAIVISSVNGHGAVDGARLARVMRGNSGTARVPLVIGGKLGLTGSDDRAHARMLLAAGFTRVFDDTDAGKLIGALAELLRPGLGNVVLDVMGAAA